MSIAFGAIGGTINAAPCVGVLAADIVEEALGRDLRSNRNSCLWVRYIDNGCLESLVNIPSITSGGEKGMSR